MENICFVNFKVKAGFRILVPISNVLLKKTENMQDLSCIRMASLTCSINLYATNPNPSPQMSQYIPFNSIFFNISNN